MNVIFSVLVTIFLSVIVDAPLRAEDWKTTDGKIYRDVTVMKSEADAVTILHRDGGALVPLAELPPDLQKRFHYDPAQASKAAAARAVREARDVSALQKEAILAKKLKAAEEAAEKTKPVSETGPAAPAVADPTHHAQDDLLHDDRNDPSHRSTGYAAANRDGRNTTGETHPFTP